MKRRRQGAAPLELLAQGQPWQRPERDEDIVLPLYRLLTGFDHFGECGGREAARELWELVREPFIAGHVERRPGTRPWAWWEFDAPEPRRMLEGSPERISPAAVTWMGAPSAHACEYEREAEALRRFGDLRGAELAAWRKSQLGRGYVGSKGSYDPATAYAARVAAGNLPACKAIQWACQRHLDDLENGWRDGFFWDRRALHYRMAFARYIRHYQGLCPGEVYRPEPWQWFAVGSLWGWQTAEGSRRYRSGLLFLPRGSGKTFMAAESALELLIADDEPGAEIWAGATKREQAAKAVRDAIGIRERSPLIAAHTEASGIKIRAPKEIHHPRSLGFIKTMTAESAGEQGHNVHGGVLDEIAQYKDGGMAEALSGGTGKRRQPLLLEITTAGPDAEGWGGLEYQFHRDILDPDSDTEAPRVFSYIAELDDREAWSDAERWGEYMPNLGVSHTREDVAAKAEKAVSRPELLADHLTYRCNVWAEAAETWLPWETISQDKKTRGGWKWCATAGTNAIQWRREQLERLKGERCVLGLDISSKIDLTALLALFLDTDPLIIIPWYWMPAEQLARRAAADRVPYGLWRRQGFLEATPGEVIDQDAIYNQIAGAGDQAGLAARYDVLSVGVDPWNAGELTKRLKDGGIEVEDVRQTITALSESSKMLEGLIYSGGIDHGHNPVLSWNARNATARRDSNGNIAPDKSKATRKRIDGISALVNALHRRIHHDQADTEPVVWAEFLGGEQT